MYRRSIRIALLLPQFLVSFLVCEKALSHSFGDGAADLTPPMVVHAEDVVELKKAFGTGAPVLRGVFNDLNLWPSGTTLIACFYGGEPKLRDLFVTAARLWLPETSLKVDFGGSNGFRECNNGVTADIRISFNQKGSWSYIGTDSLRPEIIKKGASLNIQTDGLPFERLNLQRIKETVTHEFGHAIGLLHEHQSPEAHCGDEFDWPKIFDFAQKNWGWNEEEVRTNFEPYISDPRLRETPYDRDSIMHYALADWMFKKGKLSRCYVSEPRSMSKLDRATALAAYPADVALQDKELQKRATKVGISLSRLNLDTTQLAAAGKKIAYSMSHFNRKLKLRFAVSSDGVIRGPSGDTLNPCEGESMKMTSIPTVSCGVAPDGSSLVLELNPN
jgi:hypothetical protein